jgi:hypothetical protein
MVDRKFVPLGFLFAGVLALAAGLVPMVRGQSLNLTFCIFGVVFAAMAAATWRRREGGDGPRPGT